MDLLTALPLPPLTLLFLLAMCFLAGFVDAVAGGGGLISLPAFLTCGLPSHVAFACKKCQSAIGTTFSTARFPRPRSAWPGIQSAPVWRSSAGRGSSSPCSWPCSRSRS